MSKCIPKRACALQYGVSGGALALTLMMAGGAMAQTAPAAQAAEPAEGVVEEIVVTSFRRSLDAALNAKRDSVSSVDVIVAEDIAKFPDQNLAESLQRVPGISIVRDGGEGRAITVRGLGSQFTRVRVNGMEAIATTSDGASANRERGFDFNVFASELFSSLVVHKTAEASLDEGSLGAVVDLNTGNPMRGKDGFTMALSAQGQYNDLSDDLGPRVAGLVNYRAPSGFWAASISAAYSQQNQIESTNNTVRWAQARFNRVGTTNCFTTQNSGGTYVPSDACNQVALAFHPRIPRYGEINHDRERLGVTGSLQFAPTDRTKLSIDGLFSRYKAIRNEKWGEVLFRSNERSISVRDYTIDSNNNLIKGTFDNAWVRIEHYERKLDTTFQQLSANLQHEFSDKFKIDALAGFSKSDADIPYETTIIFDDRDATGYRYDYTDMKKPVLAFGTSVTDPTNFQFAEFRDRPSNNTNKFKTFALNGDWAMTEAVSLKGGVSFRQFDFDLREGARDSTYCAAFTCATGTYGAPVTAALAQSFTLKGAEAPAGTTTSWAVPNLQAATALINLYQRPLIVQAGNTRSVTEKDTGAYLQMDLKSQIAGIDYALNAGVRYVKTDQSSTGINNSQSVTVDRKYTDWLPAANFVLYPTDKLILRLSAAEVMTRPNLSTLSPGGTVDGFNYRVTFGNPQLDPYRAKSYDAAVEWYFARESIFSVAVFQKDIDSFPISATRQGTYASTGLPTSLILASSPAAANPEGQPWTINTTVNGQGGKLKGVEFAVQGPFSFLPGFWSNFGGIANVTLVDSDVDYTVQGAATNPTPASGFPVLVSRTERERLFNLSRRAYNATLYYEADKFSARASVAYRSGFIDATSGTGNVFEGYNSSINVDASMRYRVNDNLEVSLEGVNLTDEYRDRFTDLEAKRNYEYNHFGRTIMFGVRYKM
ncbi:TonB-dependent receptor [Caulobacter sp. BP25]|uniref:TonB-dependent receptor n=1 Tax=Caulobacter sp. BP25 TaxID=2048900 RepID=UPI000C12AA73|nr:TonB-dependent receptor [Caulobacter sp. BP25]PHY18063.1 TonB-dependent receptor [Caulobacter sp. BP25]